MRRRNIAVDFDGVIHSYTSKWTVSHEILDPPVPGAFKWIEDTIKDYNVIIHSCRLTPNDNTEASYTKVQIVKRYIIEWFVDYGISMSALNRLEFWDKPGKPHAMIYIDDRGYRFAGSFPSASEIQHMTPWKSPRKRHK